MYNTRLTTLIRRARRSGDLPLRIICYVRMYASKNTHKNENVNTQMWICELSVSARVCASVFTRDRLKGEKGKTRDKESEKQSRKR